MIRRGLLLVSAALFFSQLCFAAETSSAVDATSDFIKALEKGSQEQPAPKATIAPVKTSKESVKAPAKKSEKKDEKKKEEKEVIKKVDGVVTFIRKNKMAIQFSDSEEILLKIDKDVRLDRVKDFSEIAQGDKVSVKFVETFREPKEKGGERFVLSMVVKEITLTGKAQQGLAS